MPATSPHAPKKHTPGEAAGKVSANDPLLLIDPVLVSARSGRAGYVTGRRKTPLHLAACRLRLKYIDILREGAPARQGGVRAFFFDLGSGA